MITPITIVIQSVKLIEMSEFDMQFMALLDVTV